MGNVNIAGRKSGLRALRIGNNVTLRSVSLEDERMVFGSSVSDPQTK
jgi:hypothetical protein